MQSAISLLGVIHWSLWIKRMFLNWRGFFMDHCHLLIRTSSCGLRHPCLSAAKPHLAEALPSPLKAVKNKTKKEGRALHTNKNMYVIQHPTENSHHYPRYQATFLVTFHFLSTYIWQAASNLCLVLFTKCEMPTKTNYNTNKNWCFILCDVLFSLDICKMTVCKSDSKTLKRTDITSYWWILHAIITQIKLSTWTFSSHTRLQLEKTHANSCFSAHFLWWLSGENTRTKFIIIWAFYIAHWKQFQIKHQYCFNFALLHNSNTQLTFASGSHKWIWL